MMRRTLFALGAILLLALFLFPTSQAFAASSKTQLPASNFVASCSNILVTGSGVLTASCRMRNGTSRATALDLNPFIGNNNGSLDPSGSNFVASCSRIGGTSVLVADCRMRNGTLNFTALDLNPFVDNSNGALQWG